MEKKKINLLAIQMESAIADLRKNIEKAESLIEKSLRKTSADFVFLPEVWTCGWDCSSFSQCAEDIENSKSISMLKRIAKKHKTNIIGGSFIQKKGDGKLANTCPVINKFGEIITTYEKNHLFSYYGCDEGAYITAGKNPVMVELDGVKLGLTICYDIRFPEIYRAYRKAGADILVNIDGDNQYNANEIEKLIEPIIKQNIDITIGARPINKIKEFSIFKKILQKFSQKIIKTLFF